MAKRSFGNVNYTMTGIADNTALTGPFQAIKGGSATQLIDVIEVYLAGMAAASAPTFAVFARDLVLAVTPTALANPAYDGPMNAATAALAAPPVTMTAAGTGPSRSNTTTDAKIQLGFNAFGGIVRWVAAPGEEWKITGSGTTVGESSLSSFNAGTPGLMNSHIIYEPF